MRPRGSDWAAQPPLARDDAMAIVVGVAGEGDVEVILEADSRCMA